MFENIMKWTQKCFWNIFKQLYGHLKISWSDSRVTLGWKSSNMLHQLKQEDTVGTRPRMRSIVRDCIQIRCNVYERVSNKILFVFSYQMWFAVEITPYGIEFKYIKLYPGTIAAGAMQIFFFEEPWPLFIKKTLSYYLTGIWIPNLRRSENSVRFIMGIHMPTIIMKITKDFSIALQIHWSLQIFLHGTTNVLLWHV